jgi:hypothetical protein
LIPTYSALELVRANSMHQFLRLNRINAIQANLPPGHDNADLPSLLSENVSQSLHLEIAIIV